MSEGTTVRRYEMRDLAAAPRFANPDLGLGNPAMVSTRPALSDLTILDTADHRLLRAGIVLAHRSMDGEGAWLLAAPTWSPQLPAEHVEAMTSGDVPEAIQAVLAPLLRGAPLAPVGTQRRSRVTYLVRTTDRVPLGSVVDDHVTIRRDGEVLTQYREVCVDTGTMSRTQVEWVDEVLRGAEGIRVDRQLPLASRLRILTNDDAFTGAIDLSVTGPVDTDASMAEIVGHFISQGAHEVLLADLNVRSGRTRKVQPLVRALRRFASEVPVVAPVLPHGHIDELARELLWAADELDGAFGADQEELLTGDRYLGIFERISKLRTPTLAQGIGTGSAREEIGGMVAEALDAMLRAGRAAPHTLDDTGWKTAAAAAERLVVTAELAALLAPKQARKLRNRASELFDGLVACDNDELQALRASLGSSSPEEAFGIGRRYAGLADTRAEARTEFTEHWPKDRRKVYKAARELLERLGIDGLETTEDPESAPAGDTRTDG
ncbi:hypothetical protein [Raineyella antarctica]|uniref:hypothetical protein n=1 Tax=Raineyella antarctica TaxID=1577474 RepID=UPI001114E5FD|nr:hypothetical protein [Raineyella antarctica]